MTNEPWFTPLPGRGLLRIEGPDKNTFLQGLITNDIRRLEPGKLLYACLLTPQGKFMHDVFIREEQDALLLDCEGGERAKDLAKRLTMYRLRSNVTITLEENHPTYAVFGASVTAAAPADPRHPDMGGRTFEKPDGGQEQPFDTWDRLRISLTIPDGSRDLIPANSTMDEAHMDTLDAVSYDKGCYLGQELTARLHHKGKGKKHLYTVTPEILGLKSFPAPFTEIRIEGKNVGEMRSHCGHTGLALLKDEFADQVITGAENTKR